MIFFNKVCEGSVDLWMQKRWEKGPLFEKWEFPGGKIEMLETPTQAVLREVEEEVGLQIQEAEVREFYQRLYESPAKDGSLRKILLHVFFAPVKNQYLTTLAEKGQFMTLNFDQKSQVLAGDIPPINHEIIDYFLSLVQKHKEEFEDLLIQ